MSEAFLAQRYGVRHHSRKMWWVLGAIFVPLGIIAVAVLVWLQPTAHIEYSVPKYVDNPDGSSVDVTVTVTMAPGSTARCAVQALGDGQSTVGWRYIDVPASTEYTQSLTVTVRTVQTPIAATAPQCWLTSD